MSDPCQSIADQIQHLEQLIDQLHEELKFASGPEKSRLIFELKKTLSLLGQKRKDLEACQQAPHDPPVRDPHIFGMEVTQGLPDYELVAGKDTLARIFVGAPQPEIILASETNTEAGFTLGRTTATLHFDLPPLYQSTLDFALLHVEGPGGIDFDVPAQMPTGVFTNLSKSYSEENNVNFYIDGAHLSRVGSYRFSASLYRNGDRIGSVSLGSHRFHPTKDLRLLIVVDTWPMPTAAWNTLFEALRYVQRNFPVRAGLGPLDGDQSHGLRYAIDPVPFDPDFPGWGPVRQRIQAFNDQQQAQGKPDRAEHILTVRTQQPGESPLGGVGEAGPGGVVSGVTLNVNPAADDVFATLICQEIGHNFLGSAHTPDPGINAPAAFNMVDRRTITDPRSIMFAFYTQSTNEQALFLPDDWKAIREGLLAKESTGPD